YHRASGTDGEVQDPPPAAGKGSGDRPWHHAAITRRCPRGHRVAAGDGPHHAAELEGGPAALKKRGVRSAECGVTITPGWFSLRSPNSALRACGEQCPRSLARFCATT